MERVLKPGKLSDGAPGGIGLSLCCVRRVGTSAGALPIRLVRAW
mgnify:CR=1 FL=1